MAQLKSGSTVGGKQISTTDHTHSPESLGAAALFGPIRVVVPVSGWAGAGPWTQTVTVAGVTAAMDHIGIFPVDVADATARKAYEKAYSCLAVEADTVAGGITLTCRDGKPETDFQIIVRGVK